MEIQIPSPSVFLRPSPVLANAVPAPVKNAKPAKPRAAAPPKATAKNNTATAVANAQNGGIVKPKQSKSRNGCMTCKKKRLKCDETKPTCVQCEKRNVECEGYKKDYKWRSFEETNKTSRAAKGKKVEIEKKTSGDIPELEKTVHSDSIPVPKEEHSLEEKEGSWSPGLQNEFNSAPQAVGGPSPPRTSPAGGQSPRGRYSPSHLFEPLPILNPGFSPSDFDLPPLNHSNRHRDHHNDHRPFSPGSPDLINLLLPGTDLRQPPDMSEPRPPMSPIPYQPGLCEDGLSPPPDRNIDDDFDEEILRNPMNSRFEDLPPAWNQRCPSPALSDASSTSSKSTDLTLLRPPLLDPSSPEMLMGRFVQETCAILSVKDGPRENPWRNLVLDLGQGCEALHHAISSMSALHGATRNRQLRSAGIGHMNKSIRRLSAEIQSMRLDQALATSLALALGEGWDERISTGIVHLKGAKLMLNKALTDQDRNLEQGLVTPNDAKRMKFLCNTYVYLDVIARLTSMEEQAPLDLDHMLEMADRPFRSNLVEVDPLMGCATTLFPLMGKVAALILRVRKTRANSLNIIDEATQLREQLLDWNPPDHNFVEPPEDANSSVHHAVNTAEAYRQAILLHLYQAVPELASEPSHVIAHNIMRILAGVPPSSNTLIVQIYPLLVGSCEMESQEDRDFATKRWESMLRRLNIMNVTSCWQIVQEVWARRDEYRAKQRLGAERPSSSDRNFPGTQFMPANLKRKTTMPDGMQDQFFVDVGHTNQGFMIEHGDRQPKRRLTFDVPGAERMSQKGRQMPFTNRRPGDAPISNIEPEYTVRGHLHWLAVMNEWQWEVFLG